MLLLLCNVFILDSKHCFTGDNFKLFYDFEKFKNVITKVVASMFADTYTLLNFLNFESVKLYQSETLVNYAPYR